jgi:uncharacterized cupin superfamily protein
VLTSTIVRFEPNGPTGELKRLDDFPTSILETDQPVQHGYSYFEDSEHGFFTGVWRCTPFITKLRPYPFHEFMLILEGSVTIVESGGRETRIRAGEAFVIPQGLNCQWKQTGPLRKYYTIFEDASGRQFADHAALRVVRPDPRDRLKESPPPPTELLLSSAPVQHALEWFVDVSGQWAVGVWETTAYRRKSIPFPQHELMRILDGSVKLTDQSGKTHCFTAGDTFLIPSGTVCEWNCSGYLRKIYCRFQPIPTRT